MVRHAVPLADCRPRLAACPGRHQSFIPPTASRAVKASHLAPGPAPFPIAGLKPTGPKRSVAEKTVDCGLHEAEPGPGKSDSSWLSLVTATRAGISVGGPAAVFALYYYRRQAFAGERQADAASAQAAIAGAGRVPIVEAQRAEVGRDLICPLLSGPSTMRVWIKVRVPRFFIRAEGEFWAFIRPRSWPRQQHIRPASSSQAMCEDASRHSPVGGICRSWR